MLAIAELCTELDVVTGQPPQRRGPWRAALASAFEYLRAVHSRLSAETRAGRLTAPVLLQGRLPQFAAHIQDDLQQDYPLELHSPFEGAADRKSTRLNSSHSQISYAV